MTLTGKGESTTTSPQNGTDEQVKLVASSQQATLLRKAHYRELTWPRIDLALLLRIEDWVRRTLIHFAVPSRAVTFAWFLVGLTASAVTALGKPWWFVVGALLVYVKIVLDIADGELGRYQKRFMKEEADLQTHMQGIYLDRMQHAIESPIWGLALGVGTWQMTGEQWFVGCGIVLAFFRSLCRFDQILRQHISETFKGRVTALQAKGICPFAGGKRVDRRPARLAQNLTVWVRNGKRLNLLVLAAGLLDTLVAFWDGRVIMIPGLVAGATVVAIGAMVVRMVSTQFGGIVLWKDSAPQQVQTANPSE